QPAGAQSPAFAAPLAPPPAACACPHASCRRPGTIPLAFKTAQAGSIITEPSGTIDSSKARYEALDDRTVRVTGSAFNKANRTTIKLEGAELAGYQSVIVAGVREPFILRQLDSWLEAMQARFAERVQEVFRGRVAPGDYAIRIRVYGRDGVMGKLEPRAAELGHEVCLLITVTAADQKTAKAITKSFAHFALHFPIPEWGGLISGLAFPFTPSEMDKGAVYRFTLNHIVVPDDPQEMFRTELLEV
ncbi:MAG TPA: hypothetical protein VGN83_05120, partial [Falsiroseomonas sp.]|nr:hypothetical protein [Falsiroseomonas sp.]